jgi:23S rRNA (cytidine1920-2'-O)/16S rRNA (cytidine1409-2'-O)-methyltransferase
VVREREARVDAIAGAAESARAIGLSVLGAASSGLPGPAGNRETFLWLAEAGRDGDVQDLQALAGRVETDTDES